MQWAYRRLNQYETRLLVYIMISTNRTRETPIMNEMHSSHLSATIHRVYCCVVWLLAFVLIPTRIDECQSNMNSVVVIVYRLLSNLDSWDIQYRV